MDGVLASLIGAVALAGYAPRVARDLGWVDSVELTLAAASFGIPHPTGYPLYLLWTRLAFLAGGIAGVNCLSAVAAAVAVALAFGLARALGLTRAGAVVAAAALAWNPELIRQATVAEVYTCHLVLVVLLLWLAVAIGRSAAGFGARAGDGFAYGLGLGLAHHLTILFTLPAALVFGWPAGRARGAGDRKPWIRRLALLALPLTLYGVLLVRSRFDPGIDLGDPATVGRLLAHATGRQFSYRMVSGEQGYLAGELAAWGRRTLTEWPLLLLGLAVLGLAALAGNRARRRSALGLLLLGGITGLHAAAYRIPDKEPYFLPATLALALLAGAGSDAVASAARRLARSWAGTTRVLEPGVAWVLVALVGWALGARSAAVDRHADRSLRDLAVEVFRRAPDGAVILADDLSLAFALDYLQQEPSGPRGRTVVATYFLPLGWYAATLSHLDPELPTKVERLAQARRGLAGRALGDRLAADTRALAAELGRQAAGVTPLAFRIAAGRPVRFSFHDFDREHPTLEGLALVDLGLVYALAPGEGELNRPEPEFLCLDRYTSGRVLTREERSLAKRLAAAANRSGIADVRAQELVRAEVEFGRAIALDSLYTQAWMNRGLLRADYLHMPDAALADWRRYLSLAPPGPEAEAVRARVTALDSARSRP